MVLFQGSCLPTVVCSRVLMLPRACVPRVLYSQGPVFQGSYVPQIIYSKDPVFAGFNIQQILCSLGSTLRWNYRILCKVNVMCHIKLENMGHWKHRTWPKCSLRENIIHVLCTKLSLICHFLPLDISEKFHLTLWTFCTKKSQVFQ